MKKILAALALAVLAVFSVAACGENEPPPPSKAELYVHVVRDNADVPAGVSNRDLVDVGHEFCHMLDEGYTMDDILYALLTEAPDADPAYVGTVAGAAVGAFCPKYGDQIG